MSRFTKFLSLFMVTLLFSVAVIGSASAASVSITGPSTMKGGGSRQKQNTLGYSTLAISSWTNCHGSVRAWVYKDGVERVTHIEPYYGTVSKTLVLFAGFVVQDDYYHPVFETNSQLGDEEEAKITYSFTP